MHESDALRRAAWITGGVYALFVVYGTTIPWAFDLSAQGVAARFAAIDWSIVHVEGGRLRGVPDLVSNLLFFTPLGVAGALALGARRGVAALFGGILGGGLLSTGVEALQLLTVDRTTQLGDVVFNATGCGLAAGATVWLRSRGPAWREHPAVRWLRAEPARTTAALMVLVLIAAGLSPFDVTLDVGDVKGSIKGFLGDPMGIDSAAEVIALLGPSVLAGALVARVVSPVVAIVGLTALAACLEVGQIFIASRWPGLGAVALTGAGALAGALARRASAGVVLGGFVVYVTAGTLAPFRLLPPEVALARLDPRALLPFWHYYAYTHANVVEDLLGGLATYGVLGYLFASRGGTRAALRAGIAAAALAASLELAQIFIAGRTVGVGDVLIAGAGAAVGARLCAWVAAFAEPPIVAVGAPGTSAS